MKSLGIASHAKIIGVNHQPTTTMKLICNLSTKQIKAIYAKYDHPEDRFDALVEAERDAMECGNYPAEEEKEEPLTPEQVAMYDDAYFAQLLKDEEADAYFNRPDIYNPQKDDTY